MLNLLSFPLVKTSLGILVFINCLHSLTQTTMAATFRLFPDTFIDDNLSLKIVTTQDLIGSDLLAELIPTQNATATFDNGSTSESIREGVSGESNLSFESIVSSLNQINLDATSSGGPAPEVPILPQVEASDINKGIYEFETTSAAELSDPVSIGIIPVLDDIPTPGGGVNTSATGIPAGIAVPGVNDSSLPRFGGPVQIIASPSANFTTPLSQVGLPSATSVQARSWGDSQVAVVFTSLPEAEVGNIDEFMRTVYRTSPSDMVERIDESLKLTVDTELRSTPTDIFPANAMPSGDFNRNL